MRSMTFSLFTCTVLLLTASSVPAVAQAPPPPPPPRETPGQPPQTVTSEAAAFANPLSHVAVPPISDQELAGLPRASQPPVLTWERIFALALIRARTRRGPFAPTLDLAAVADVSARLGVADFARFRTDFRAGGSFRDPGPAVLALERRLLAIEAMRRNVAALESLVKFLVELTRAESAGLTQIDVDTVLAALLRARQNLADETRAFRDDLDELKFLLGLAPTAPVVLDRACVKAITDVFDAVDRWAAAPHRSLAELSRVIDRFPTPGAVILNGEPLLERIKANPDLWEDCLSAAAGRAQRSRSERDEIQVQPNAGVQLELRVRRRMRGLYEKSLAFDAEKRRFELVIRLRDQALERLFPPSPAKSPAVNSRSGLVPVLLEQLAQGLETQDRLASLWTSFRAERLSLYQDLGVLPYGDWKSFFADLTAVPAVAASPPPAQVKPAKNQSAARKRMANWP